MPIGRIQPKGQTWIASTLLAIWLTWGGATFLCAQNLTLRQMDHTAWTARDGAPIGVNSIAAAQDGTLWLATRGGLYRFDGLHFNAYSLPAGEPSLPSIEMRSVYMASDGALSSYRNRRFQIDSS
jgi:hypothetical protein